MNSETMIPATFPVEFIERTICLAEDAYQPQIGGVLVFEDRVDQATLKRAVRLLFDAEPVLGCRFDVDGAPPMWHRLVDLDSVQLLAIREAVDAEEDAASFVAERLDFVAGPQLLAALIHGPASDSVAVKVSHVVMDGGALKETLYMLAAFYRTLTERPDWTPEPNLEGVRRPVVRSGLLEKIGAMRHQSDLTLRPSDWHMPLKGGRGRATYVSASVGSEVFRRAVELGKAEDATANDVILAAYYRTLWRLLGAGPGAQTPVMNSCELRKFLPEGTRTALSNISSAWYVSVSSPLVEEDFTGTLSRVAAATREWKSQGAGRNSAIGIPIITRLTRKKDMEYVRKLIFGNATADVGQQVAGLTNIGVIDDARLDFGSTPLVCDAWLLGPVSHVALILTTTTHRDRLHLVLGAELSALSDELAEGVVGGTATEIEAWVASRQAT